MKAADLRPGDQFLSLGTPVTVLRDQEPWTDLFGRDMLRYWCRREDTGAEGWMYLGPTGVVRHPSEATP